MEIRVRKMEPGDWESVRRIYGAGIATGVATFETEVPSRDAWDRGHLERCRLVAETDGAVVGWADLRAPGAPDSG